MKKSTKRPSNPPALSSLCQEAGRAFGDMLERLRPPEEARRHFQTARVEVLKGLRAVLDARIEKRARGQRKGEQINVE